MEKKAKKNINFRKDLKISKISLSKNQLKIKKMSGKIKLILEFQTMTNPRGLILLKRQKNSALLESKITKTCQKMLKSKMCRVW